MSRRRLRITAAGALLALAAPVFAAQAQNSSLSQSTAQMKSQAQEFARTVQQNSTELSHRVAISAREAGRQFSTGMQQFNQSVHQWWDSVRVGTAHAKAATEQGLHSA